MNRKDKITLAIFVFVTITAGFFGYLLDQILTEQPEGNSLGMGHITFNGRCCAYDVVCDD